MDNRPSILLGDTWKVKVGCGNLYITVNFNEREKPPVEIFARLGKSGGCSYCQLEGLTKSITLGLKWGVPISEFVDKLKGIRCPIPIIGGASSCLDAIAGVLEKYDKGE